MVDEKFTLEIFEHYFEDAQDIISRGRYSFSESDGALHIYGNVRAYFTNPMPDGMWPLQFGTIHGDVDMSNSGLHSLEGSPQAVYGSMSVANNPLVNLKGCTQQISAQLDISRIEFTSLEGLPPDVSVRITWSPNMPMLRLLTSKWIELDHHQMPSAFDTPHKQVLMILRKWRKQGKRAAHLCAKELIAAGFEGNARW